MLLLVSVLNLGAITRDIYMDYSTNLTAPLSGAMEFSGIQLQTPAFTKYLPGYGGGYRTQRVEFNKPDLALKKFVENVPEAFRKKIFFEKPSHDEFLRIFKIQNDKDTRPKQVPLAEWPAIFDEESFSKSKPQRVHPLALPAFRTNFDFHLVIVAGYDWLWTKESSDSPLADLIAKAKDASYRAGQVTPQVTLVIYKSSGVKIFSKQYKKKFINVREDISLYDHVYYTYLGRLIEEKKDEILSDIGDLKGLADQVPEKSLSVVLTNE